MSITFQIAFPLKCLNCGLADLFWHRKWRTCRPVGVDFGCFDGHVHDLARRKQCGVGSLFTGLSDPSKQCVRAYALHVPSALAGSDCLRRRTDPFGRLSCSSCAHRSFSSSRSLNLIHFVDHTCVKPVACSIAHVARSYKVGLQDTD